MIIDCHYHIDEDTIKTKDLIKYMDEEGVDKIALMAAICPHFPDPGPGLVKLVQFLYTNKHFRFLGKKLAENFTQEGNVKIPGHIIEIYPDPDNSKVAKAIKKYPKKFLGWIFINPTGKNDPLEEIRKWKDAPGFIGIKTHPFWHRYTPDKLIPAARIAAEHNMPMLCHLGYNEGSNITGLISEVPELKLILAHAGFPNFRESWKEIKKNKNIYVDLSQTTYVSKKLMKEVVDYLGPERCIYGTDGAFGLFEKNTNFHLGRMKDWIIELFPDKEVQKMLLGDNFCKIANIK